MRVNNYAKHEQILATFALCIKACSRQQLAGGQHKCFLNILQ